MDKPVCLITGAGAGTGAAVAKRFSQGGYQIAMLARDKTRLNGLEKEIDEAYGYECDVAEIKEFQEVLDMVRVKQGPASVAVHNAVAGRPFATVLDATPEIFEKQFRVNATALMVLAQSVAPGMIDAKKGAILVTGNTAAWRGKANYSMFAPTKAAQRILAEAMARDLGPQGIHVAHFTIDAAIDTPWTRPEFFPDAPDEFFAKPKDIADTMYYVAHQEPSAWTFSLDLRPASEKW